MVDRLSIEAMRLIGVRETADRLAGPSRTNHVILDEFGPPDGQRPLAAATPTTAAWRCWPRCAD
jgi:hypothetical protein